jgi:hypothetical protein
MPICVVEIVQITPDDTNRCSHDCEFRRKARTIPTEAAHDSDGSRARFRRKARMIPTDRAQDSDARRAAA